jgi:retinol-binding protein 3
MVLIDRFARFCALAAMLCCALSLPAARATALDVLDATERSQLIPAICALLQAEYVFPDVAAKMAKSLQAHAQRGEYAAISDGPALAKRVTEDLRAINRDGHLWAEYHPEGARTEPEFESIADMDATREEGKHWNFSFRKVERMVGNVGYIELRGFWDPYLASGAMNAAMAFVANTDALIIDLRQNQGGEPNGVAYLASFLFDTRTHLNDIVMRRDDRILQYWTAHVPGPIFGGQKPVYILTSKTTISGAEDFAYALKHLKRATIIGETTGGGAHPTRQVKVTEHFSVWVPFARGHNHVTRTDWEGTGVTPDMSVPAADALNTAYRTVLRKLAGSIQDPEEKRDVEKLLANPAAPGR